jgi:glycosyltransferase involved in cell wall biosynthesis
VNSATANPRPPRVSVALCSCDGETFLAQQLDSIARQSVPVNELVVCDDASTDGTAGILDSFAGRLPIRKFVNRDRLGVTRNFERAVRLCTGDIIFLCDQDDVWHDDKVRTLLKPFTDPAVGLVFSNARVVRDDQSPAGYRLWESIWFDSDEQRRFREGDSVSVLSRHAVAAGSTAAFRADFRPLLLPFPDLPHAHDIWIALLLAAVSRIEPVDRDLIDYRLHDSNHVGMRRYGLLGQIRMARQQIHSNAFGQLAELHQSALDRLGDQSVWPVSEATLELLRCKAIHAGARRDLPRRWWSRLSVVGSEVRKGNYFRFSYGYKSVLQDLFLR